MPSAFVQFSTDDLKTPDGIERVLRQFQTALGLFPSSASPHIPTIGELVGTLAPLLRNQLQAPGAFPLNLQSLLPTSLGTSVFTEDTHANRLVLYTPPSIIGTVFFEVDRTVTYVVADNSGTLVWRYASGSYVSIFANRPTDLGVNDSGFLFFATDQINLYLWNGSTWDTISRRIFIGGFYAIFTHANSADRTYTLPDATGTLTYETAVLTNNNFLFGGGGALVKDSGFAVVPAASGGTGIAYDRVADTVALTAQVAAIGSTNFANSGTGTTFRVSYYLEDTAADLAAGTIQLTVAFTDAAGATTVVSAALPLTALGRTSGVFFIQRASGNVAYSTTLVGIIGTATYALYISFERLS